MIAVLGAGSWGTSLANLLVNKGYKTNLWLRNTEQYKNILDTRINTKYLPKTKLHDDLKICNDIEEALQDVRIILLAVPSQAIRDTLINITPYVKDEHIFVNVSKGIEKNTGLRISEVVDDIFPDQPFAVLSGPSHAEEVSEKMPTTLVVASKNRIVAEFVQDIFITPYLRVYTNPDVTGVELGGALKNVIAFGAGICDGLDFGDNAKAALMTRGIREIARLGTGMGAKMSTFAGLSGIGDLIVTCTSMHSRNRRAGIMIGKGYALEQTLKEIGMVVEGITTTEVAYTLAKKHNIEMPITEEIFNILYKGRNAKDAVTSLMARNRTNEMEEIVEQEGLEW